MNENHWMQKAVDLAEKGRLNAHPNPMVGCVIVKGRQVVGSGYHAYFGGPHAEVNALKKAGRRAVGATMYVTLEPCSTSGKTPPCIEKIISSGIKRVVMGCKDPNPKHAGRAIGILRRRGITTKVGVLKALIEKQNETFFTAMKKKRPFVTLKLAMSLDGKIATKTGDSKWISNNEARRRVHLMRAESDAIMVGSGTVSQDDATLNVRRIKQVRKEPFKVLLDSTLKISLKSSLLTKNKRSRVIIFTSTKTAKKKIAKLNDLGVQVHAVREDREGHLSLKAIFRILHGYEVRSLLVEGGAHLAGHLFDGGFVDKVYFFLAPIVIGGRRGISAVQGIGVKKIQDAFQIRNLAMESIGNNMLITGYSPN